MSLPRVTQIILPAPGLLDLTSLLTHPASRRGKLPRKYLNQRALLNRRATAVKVLYEKGHIVAN